MSICATCPDLGPRIHSLRPQSCPLVRGAHRGPGSLGYCTVTLPLEASPAGVSFRSGPLGLPGKGQIPSSLGALTIHGDGLSLYRVNLDCRPAAWTSPTSRLLDAQPDPADSVSVPPQNPPGRRRWSPPRPAPPSWGCNSVAASSAVEPADIPLLCPRRPSNQPKR